MEIRETAYQPQTVPEWNELLEALNEKKYTLKDFNISARTLSSWFDYGLISGERDKKHFFSFIEYVWLQFVIELRTLELPLKTIKAVKENLFTPLPLQALVDLGEQHIEGNILDDSERMLVNSFHEADKTSLKELREGKGLPDNENITLLALFISKYLATRQNIFLLIRSTGEVLPLTLNRASIYNQFNYWDELEETHIQVSLKKILKDFIIKDKDLKEAGKIHLLSTGEEKALAYIRAKNLASLTIRFSDNSEMSLIETKQRIDHVNIESRFLDQILKHGYQDIAITTNDGKIVKFEKITKYKL